MLDFDGPTTRRCGWAAWCMDKLGVFPQLGHYGGLHRGVPVVTIELEQCALRRRRCQVRAMWRDLRHWMNTRLLDGADAVPGEATRPAALIRPGFE